MTCVFIASAQRAQLVWFIAKKRWVVKVIIKREQGPKSKVIKAKSRVQGQKSKSSKIKPRSCGGPSSAVDLLRRVDPFLQKEMDAGSESGMTDGCLRFVGFWFLKSRCNDAEQKAWARVPATRMS